MRAPGLVLAAALAVPCAAQPVDWKPLNAMGLSIIAPPGTTLVPSHVGDAATWRASNAAFDLRIAYGPAVADGDDGEPALCYTTAPLAIDGRTAMLRTAKSAPRLDCPERYLSLYLKPAHPGAPALYVSGEARSYDDLAAARAAMATIRLSL